MFVLLFTLEGRPQPVPVRIKDQDEAIALFKEFSPRGGDAKDVVLETVSIGGMAGFIRFCEVDLISVEMYEDLSAREEEQRAVNDLLSTVERNRQGRQA